MGSGGRSAVGLKDVRFLEEKRWNPRGFGLCYWQRWRKELKGKKVRCVDEVAPLAAEEIWIEVTYCTQKKKS